MFLVCVAATCRSVRRNGLRTLGGFGEIVASLVEPSGGDLVILACMKEDILCASVNEHILSFNEPKRCINRVIHETFRGISGLFSQQFKKAMMLKG